ncbi:uncharacterized protein SCHCODRAFT_02497230 [Schizophyllum commune H4-8]|uniref:Expressed protein n=1 Tax=Schizophyllum commune (strain H4-8 / FGSC 9210) TaxID=578458 RepID=D8Q339_SCHCM|nr:uncharacterized protein SCHCODRAFT_02497230 [Schizophyllum commune H4-8]KAI5894728.1 hypothetical protein SCHCODRAFT_02497230 [Schizophyllum commune H4-8]
MSIIVNESNESVAKRIKKTSLDKRRLPYDKWPQELKDEVMLKPAHIDLELEVYDLRPWNDGLVVFRNNACFHPKCDGKPVEDRTEHVRQHFSHPETRAEYQKYECPICALQYKSLGPLKNHINANHTHEESWTCPRPGCDTVVYSSALLKLHERLQHASDAKSASHAVTQGEGAGNGATSQGDSSSAVPKITLGKRRERSIGAGERQAKLKSRRTEVDMLADSREASVESDGEPVEFQDIPLAWQVVAQSRSREGSQDAGLGELPDNGGAPTAAMPAPPSSLPESSTPLQECPYFADLTPLAPPEALVDTISDVASWPELDWGQFEPLVPTEPPTGFPTAPPSSENPSQPPAPPLVHDTPAPPPIDSFITPWETHPIDLGDMSLALPAECAPSSHSAPVPSAPPRALDATVDGEQPTLPDDGSSVHPLDEWWVNALCDPLMSISELPSSIFSLETMQPSSTGNAASGSSSMTPIGTFDVCSRAAARQDAAARGGAS